MPAISERPPIRIQLPPLHSGQLDLDRSDARFQVVVCGRRFGKTTYGVLKCAKGALRTGGLYWWVGPSYKVAGIGWKMFKELVRGLPEEMVTIREADMQIIFSNGGSVVIKSADNPDSLRGDKLSGVVLDEFAQIREETWTDVLRPSLADLKGWALFIGTPKGKNWAYRLFEGAKVKPDWAAFRKPTSTNPYIDQAEIESARLDMSEESFAQEFEADFGASQYLVYPEVNPDIHEWREKVPEFVSYHGGMDFGGDSIGSHKSATVIAGLTIKDELIVFAAFKESGPNIAERQLNWTMEQEAKLDDVRRIMKYRDIGKPLYRADRTQMVGIQFMRNMGLNILPTRGGPDSVSEGIELVHRRLKLRPTELGLKPKVYWLKGTPYIMNDLMAYRYPEPRDEDRQQAKNPLKVDDDLDDAFRYCIEGVDGSVVGDPQKLYAASVPRMLQ